MQLLAHIFNSSFVDAAGQFLKTRGLNPRSGDSPRLKALSLIFKSYSVDAAARF